MDAQRRLRRVARSAHTRAVHALDEAVTAKEPRDEIHRLIEIVRCRVNELRLVDDALLAEEPDDTLEEEYRLVCDYRDRATSALSRADSLLRRAPPVSTSATSASSVSLPRLNLPSLLAPHHSHRHSHPPRTSTSPNRQLEQPSDIQPQEQRPDETRSVHSVTRVERTESQSRIQTRATTVRSHRRTRGGTEYEELNAQLTRSKITRQGSTLTQREAFVERRTQPPDGEEAVEQDVAISVEASDRHGEAKFRESVAARADVVFDTGDSEDESSVLAVALPLDDVSAAEGERLLLTCTVEGMRPEAEVQWRCPVAADRRRSRVFPQTGLLRLEVMEARVTDCGEYSVTVRQGRQSVVSTAQVDVRRKCRAPEFLRALPQQLTLDEDAELLLSSEVDSGEDFSYSWEKDGVQLYHDGHVICMSRDGGRLELRIRSVDTDCNGSYRLVVENSAGRRSCTAFVSVREKPPVELAFVEEPQDVRVTDGGDADLACVLRTPDPHAAVVWFINSKPLEAQTAAPDYQQQFDGRRAELHLRRLRPEHSGVYSCGVKNARHTCVTMCRVTVPKPAATPRFLSPLRDQRIRDGQTLLLECSLTERAPEAAVAWFLDGEDISGSEGQRMEFNGTTARLVVWDAFEGDCGRYRCEVRTAGGRCECSAAVSMRRDPSPEFSAGLADLRRPAGDSVRLTATLAAPVPGARVSWTFEGAPAAGVAQSDGHSVSLVLGPLERRQSGEYRVRVTSADGRRSCESSCRLTVTVPPGAAMSDEVDIDTCTDEELLAKILSKTDNMDKRRQIRGRLKDIREAEKKRMEERRKAREEGGGNVDAVRTRALMAEEEKARKLRSYQEQAKAAGQAAPKTDSVKAMAERAAQDKAERLKQFDEMAKTGGPVAFQGGLDSVRKMEQEHAAKEKERALAQFGNMQRNMHASARDEQPVPRVQNKGAAGRAGQRPPSGGKSAMSAFKAMDKQANPEAAKKPNFMANPGPARGGVTRNPSAIKQMLLEWCKAQCRGYEGVNITNFGSSWADGLAFCALIHHFYPDSFDFSSLDPKNRRHNFTLAFDTAEKLADIAPLLDVDDMVKMKVPDWKCVFTAVQSYYRRFRNDERNALRAQEPGQAKEE